MEQFKSIIYRKKLGESQNKLGESQNKLGESQNRLGEGQNKLGAKLSKNKIKLLDLIKKDPNITINILSTKIGISTTAIENNIKSLKDSNILRRVGSDKAGTWEIIDEI
jgi:ATP-dependent DNA helicase RecG